jgi:(4S)-4-hydroxy-5-phosphonooxypentane-2,3-dione isomerase
MHVVFVQVNVKPDAVEAFRQEILANATGSMQESGVIRFDVFQQADDPTRFTLVEIYHSPEDQLKHRETTHYLRWRDTVGEMMAEPRQAVRYIQVFPATNP